MRSKWKFFIVVMVGYLGIGAGFQVEERETALSGRIVYIVSNDVQEYDLASGKRRELYRNNDGILDGPITKVSELSFIVKGGGTMRLVGADGQAHVLGKGSKPVFFPAHGKLLYLSHKHLYEAKLRDNRLESQRVVSEGPFSSYPTLAISDHELLVGQDSGPYVKYDLRTGSFVDTQIEECWPAAWRSRTQEVICVDEASKPIRGHSGYALVGLDGQRRRVPGLLKLAVAVYVPQDDYVLAGRTRWSWSRGGETTDLVAYDFSTGAVRRIANRVPVGLGKHTFWSPTRGGAK